MGLFSKKTDEQIIEEARALYTKGQLEGNSLQLMKIAHKGNPEACYLISQFHLELADKGKGEKEREIYTKSAKIFLEKAVAAGHKEAIALMENKFGSSNCDANVEIKTEEKEQLEVDGKVDKQILNTLTNTGNSLKRDAMLEIIDTIEETFKLEPIKSDQASVVEKFIRNHKLGISLGDVVAYRDTAVFGSGKKGHILTEEFLYYSDNGKRGTKVEFSGIVSAESSKRYEFYVTYTNGERKTFPNTEFKSFAEYYAKLINAFVTLENMEEELELLIDAFAALENKAEELELVEESRIEENVEEKTEKAEAEAEEQARIEAERLRAEEEARAKAKVEELKRLEEEKAKLEAAIAELEKPELDSTEKVLEDIHELENKIEDAFAEKLAELEAMESVAEEKIEELEEEIFEDEESVAELSEDDEDAIAMKNIEDAKALNEEGKIDEAIEVWREYADKGYFLAEYYLAVALSEKKEYDEAFFWAQEIQNNCLDEELLEKTDNLIEKLNSGINKIFEHGVNLHKAGKLEEAFKCYKSAAGQGHVPAQYNLALMYYYGDGIPEDKQEAKEWYTCAAVQGYASAQRNLALMYYYGDGIPEDKYEALSWFVSAAERGDVISQYNAAVIYDKGGMLIEDKNEAFVWYKAAAEQGYVDAQYNLAYMYYKGEGTYVDYEKAFMWFKAAAEQGHEKARINLRVMYKKGEGIPEEEVFKRYKSAAEKGDISAQYNLALMYENGKGIPEDKQKAFKWYKSAAKKSNVDAQYKLALMYYKGGGIPEDKQKAFKWFKSASELGHGEARVELALMYYYGNGIPEDKEAGLKLLKSEEERGNIDARHELWMIMVEEECKMLDEE